MSEGRRFEVVGVVQGVGFRPFVWRLAEEHDVAGWVRNGDGTVEIHAEGSPRSLDRFGAALRTDAPPQAVVIDIRQSDARVVGTPGFAVRPSTTASSGAARRVPPDAAPCAACLAELADPLDRRHGHAFTNCTDCGPRFTIIDDLPYDRARTTLAGFSLCDRCAAEYHDPRDRRFHAEPIACPDCGPRLRIVDRHDVAFAPEPVAEAARMLRGGGIVAVKGIGGYQLACDATDEGAVAELRRRKHRPDKPLAVMVADLDAARDVAELSDAEAGLLSSPAAPIVLVVGRSGLAPSVAPGHTRVGLLLPASPLHHLLARAVGRPLVLTSGNRSDEPIATDDRDARERLGDIADIWLTHDRPIAARYDDSVTAVRLGAPAVLRRARGYAPDPLHLARPLGRAVLAVGADLQNSFCLASGTDAFVSAHIGDLDDDRTIEAWLDAVARHRRLTGVAPAVVAHDRHPDFVSTRLAERLATELGIPRRAVQHHHAHIEAVRAEHGIAGRVLGIALDGFGLGDDGTVWGGELLVVDGHRCERVGHLAPVRQPGGDLAVHQPARMALVHAEAADCLDDALATLGLSPAEPSPLLGGASADQVLAAAHAAVASPLTSSAGRLLDAVAALCGIGLTPSYEGQPAMLLEQAAIGWVDTAVLDLTPFDVTTSGSQVVLDPAPTVRAVVAARTVGTPTAVVARAFHAAFGDAVATAAVGLCRHQQLTDVCLGGGVWANDLLLARVAPALESAGLAVHVPHAVPPGDGGLCLGQAAIAGRSAAP